MSGPSCTVVPQLGGGLSHVIPVADGYVISSCIQANLDCLARRAIMFHHVGKTLQED